ncbi:MAG: hypothetical protein JRD93_13030 [Deltaproteobacteria bacterium]|nr:hypothetical protein [Deltaproteobacteria bacterium]
MKTCPRCGLPQDDESKCQYCGLDFVEKSERYISETEQPRSIYKSFIFVLLKAIIIVIVSMICLGLIVRTNGFAIIAIAPILLIYFLTLKQHPCEICGKKFRIPFFGPPGFSKITGKLYRNFNEAKKAEGLKKKKEFNASQSYVKYLSIVWLSVCQNCYENKAKLPDDLKTKELPFEFSDKKELPSELSDNKGANDEKWNKRMKYIILIIGGIAIVGIIGLCGQSLVKELSESELEMVQMDIDRCIEEMVKNKEKYNDLMYDLSKINAYPETYALESANYREKQRILGNQVELLKKKRERLELQEQKKRKMKSMEKSQNK